MTKEPKITSFNVIIYNFNSRKFENYDIIPYLCRMYKETRKEKPVTFEEFRKFIKEEAQYQWWGRCEYEVILKPWPGDDTEKKIDVYWQVMMNLDLITKIVMENVNISRKRAKAAKAKAEQDKNGQVSQ